MCMPGAWRFRIFRGSSPLHSTLIPAAFTIRSPISRSRPSGRRRAPPASAVRAPAVPAEIDEPLAHRRVAERFDRSVVELRDRVARRVLSRPTVRATPTCRIPAVPPRPRSAYSARRLAASSRSPRSSAATLPAPAASRPRSGRTRDGSRRRACPACAAPCRDTARSGHRYRVVFANGCGEMRRAPTPVVPISPLPGLALSHAISSMDDFSPARFFAAVMSCEPSEISAFGTKSVRRSPGSEYTAPLTTCSPNGRYPACIRRPASRATTATTMLLEARQAICSPAELSRARMCSPDVAR